MRPRKRGGVRAHDLTVAALSLAVLGVAIDFFAAASTGELNAIDTALLQWIRQKIPLELTRFFTIVSATGATTFLTPATIFLTLMFLRLRRRREAFLVAASMTCAAIFTYTVKALVDRPRPDLWGATWYSSSSFPSGHTLCTTALATALVLCAARLAPTRRYWAAGLAALWTALMALSRLVLGAHWPSDVLAAMVFGLLIPMTVFTLHAGGER
jgi:membrane-associated phospholipid phosphatase